MKHKGVVFLSVVLIVAVGVSAYARGRKEAPKPAAAPTATPAAPQPPAQRYIQTDSQISYIVDGVDLMHDYGCCFMSCLGIAQTAARKNLTAEQITNIRTEALRQGDLLIDKMKVHSITGIISRGLSALGCPMSVTVVADQVTYSYVKCDSILILGTTQTDKQHWVEGDASGEIVYNPWPEAFLKTTIRHIYIRVSGYVTTGG